MSKGKHAARHRAPRKSILDAPKAALIGAPVLTTVAVGAGVAAQGPVAVTAVATQSVVPDQQAKQAAEDAALADRAVAVSRSSERTTAAARPVQVTGKKWTHRALDLRVTPSDSGAIVGEVRTDQRVDVTGRTQNGFTEVVIGGVPRWVNSDFVADSRDPASLPLATSPCAGTSSVMSGLTSDADRVYTAVCNAFPQIRVYGGRDPHGEHVNGKAIDIMTSDVTLGTNIANFLRAHASELNLYNVIWRQHIWTPVRSGEGWRAMSSRGSATANHMDHVHVSVN
ncbi:MAG TPA: SH3 domain-containing protein [Marmoricola sp.]|nr:SH3 domain-containing protein [Marmoricola sp.]HNI70531.1 SH3 domain-containing protein [Marmoricola sp.]